MTYKGVIELQAKENATLRARVAELEQELELTRVERTLERQHHVEAVTRFNSVNARLDALTAENKKLREALKAIWPNLQYVGMVVTFSPADYAFMRETVRKALALPPPPEEK